MKYQLLPSKVRTLKKQELKEKIKQERKENIKRFAKNQAKRFERKFGDKLDKKFTSRRIIKNDRATIEIKKIKQEPYRSIYFKKEYDKVRKDLF